jgi:ABC-type glycerol-3-phosphate transport system substrate-binding protein
VGLLTLAACDDAMLECRSARCAPTDIVVKTWWPPNGSSPVDTLTNAATERGATVYWPYESTKGAAMGSVRRYLTRNDAPADAGATTAGRNIDVFLGNGGRDILQWTTCGGAGQVNRLLDLESIYPSLSSSYPPEVMVGSQCKAGTYAVPLALHRVNHVLYNKQRFASCGIDSPEGLSESVEDLEGLLALFECLRGNDNAQDVA